MTCPDPLAAAGRAGRVEQGKVEHDKSIRTDTDTVSKTLSHKHMKYTHTTYLKHHELGMLDAVGSLNPRFPPFF